ncbi:MAG: hypothetical protein ACREJ3_16560, partial [Polyangiaceae bacterium]
MDEIRRRVLDDCASASAIARSYGDAVFPADADPKRIEARDAAGVKNVARRLRELLSETHAVPRKLAREVGEALDR